tara:strand:+ start:718 stop:1503 length:786 start_codon:yes stop_codon:yes gene_type:complete
MNKFRPLYSFFILFLLVPQIASSCTKVMRWNDDPPYSYIDPNRPKTIKGISVDIARTILLEQGCELKLLKMPWARALESLKTGRVDIISSAYKLPEREEFAIFSSTIRHSPNILFIRATEEAKWGLRSLADIVETPFKLGVQINVSYSREFDLLKKQAEFAKHLHSNSNRKSLWRMLSLNRVDGVIADEMTGLIELNSLGLQNKIVPSSLIISNEPSFFAFSKKTTTKEFVDQFDVIYARLLKNGTIRKMENLYLTLNINQ